ncbi:hypothetical protein [Streptomyces sp. KL116D]|uniref:hypothetical protein n=1 Tax=Streptomyces sp. KL116D TaxID=3045152 RepID=UPI0035568411
MKDVSNLTLVTSQSAGRFPVVELGGWRATLENTDGDAVFTSVQRPTRDEAVADVTAQYTAAAA